MRSNLAIRPQARLDVVEQALYIGQDSTLAANRFLDACEDTFALLLESPKLGARYPTKNKHLTNLRVFRVKGFRSHLIFYRRRPRMGLRS